MKVTLRTTADTSREIDVRDDLGKFINEYTNRIEDIVHNWSVSNWRQKRPTTTEDLLDKAIRALDDNEQNEWYSYMGEDGEVDEELYKDIIQSLYVVIEQAQEEE